MIHYQIFPIKTASARAGTTFGKQRIRMPAVINFMSINVAHRAENAVNAAFIVAPPRPGDALGGALRLVFGLGGRPSDEFDLLLRRVDQADRKR